MIGSSFLSSSSWNPDDLIPFTDGSNFILVEDLENDLSDTFLDWEKNNCSPIHSSSSEDGDSIAFIDKNAELLPVPQDIEADLLNDELVDSINFDDLDWMTVSTLETEENFATDSTDQSHNSPKGQRRKRKRTKMLDHSSSSKSWSKLSVQERLKIAYALSHIVTHRMGLREQIEVIKLINPSAELSPSTKEFSINISHLNNSKLKRIKEYVRKHAYRIDEDLENSSFYDLLFGDSKSSGSSKQKQKKAKSSYLRELKLRKQKVIQQDKKERLSGLFVREKIIKKLNNPEEEEEEVNILE